MNKIYLRTSTDLQNPENQLKDCMSINKYGACQVIEERQSAFKDKDRPLFEEMKKEIQQGKVKHLICWDLDRLFRDRKKLIEFFEFCKVFDCSIHSFRQQWLEQLNQIPAPFNEIMFNLMLQIMGWLAEEESRKKSDRMKIAFQNKKGDWGRPALNPEVDNQIIKLFKEGKSLRDITKEVFYWDASRNKKFVSLGYVHKIIKNNQRGGD